MQKTSLILVCALLFAGVVLSAHEPAGKAIASVSYTYAKDGSVSARIVNGEVQRYSYDKRGQLTGVYGLNQNAIERYSYDPAGNILSKTVDGKTTTYTYDRANQLISSKVDGKTTNYAYDAAGRLVKEGDKVYTYSYYDKITSVLENGEMLASFDYYTDGQIAQANYGGRSESFVWDGLALIARNESTYLNEPHVNGGSPILADGKAVLNDMLGSSLGVRDNGFTAVTRTAFGESSDDSKYNFFTGKPMIGELGYAFLMRNYRADQGKWQTADPLGYPDGYNNFAYVNNGVMSKIDFLGLSGTLILVGEGGSSGGMFSLTAQTYQRANGGTIVNVSSGQEFVNAISNYVAQNGTIDSLQVFSHSSASALYVNQGSGASSFYADGQTGTSDAANVNNLSSSSFSANASVALWGCNTNNANSVSGEFTIAQQIANQLGLSVLGASGPTVFSGLPNGAPGEGLPTPVPADYTGGIYLVPQYFDKGFEIVRPTSE